MYTDSTPPEKYRKNPFSAINLGIHPIKNPPATERPRLTRQLRMWIAHAIGAGSGPDQNVAQSLRLPSGNDQFGE